MTAAVDVTTIEGVLKAAAVVLIVPAKLAVVIVDWITAVVKLVTYVFLL